MIHRSMSRSGGWHNNKPVNKSDRVGEEKADKTLMGAFEGKEKESMEELLLGPTRAQLCRLISRNRMSRLISSSPCAPKKEPFDTFAT